MNDRYHDADSFHKMVVVVDDDKRELDALSQLLQMEGFPVRYFDNAEAVLGFFKETLPPVLIIAKLNMPVIDGWQFCRLLRSADYSAFNKTPVLVTALSSSSEDAYLVATDQGTNAYLPVTMSKRRFLRYIESILGGDKRYAALRILSVSSNKVLLEMLTLAFETVGYSVVKAETAENALQQQSADPSEIVVLDHDTPGLADSRFIQSLINSHSALIMLTENTGPETHIRLMKQGVRICVPKPFDPDYLVDICENTWKERTHLLFKSLLETSSQEKNETEERLLQLIESAPYGVHEYQLAGDQLIFTFANKAADRILGISNALFIGKTIDEAFPSLSSTPIPAAYRQLAREGGRFEQEQVNYQDNKISGAFDITAFQVTPGHVAVFFRDITEKKRAEETVRESEANLRTILDVSPLPISWVTTEGRIEFSNRKAKELFGYDNLEYIDEWFLRAYPDPEYREEIKQKWNDLCSWASQENKDIGPVEVKVTCKNGDVRDVEIIGKLLGNRVIAIFNDITEHNRVEETLHNEKERLERALTAGKVVLWEWDLQTGILEWSDNIDALLNYQIDDSVSSIEVWENRIHPDDRQAVLASLKQHLQTGAPYNLTYRVQKQDGTYSWWRDAGFAFRNEKGEAYRMAGACVDITDRRFAEEELNKAQTILLAAIDQSPAGIMIADAPEIQIRLVNKSAVDILLMEKEDQYRISLGTEEMITWKLFWQDGTPFAVEDSPLVKTIQTGQSFSNVEVRVLRHDGSERWLLVNGSPIFNSEGVIIGGIIVFPDITEFKTAEIERKQLEDQLRQALKMESVGRLAGGIAHDFNNLLSPILGYAELLFASFLPGDPRQSKVKPIIHAAERARDLVRQLLAFSRKQLLDLKPMDLKTIVSDFEKILRRTIREDIRIEYHYPDSLRAIRADAGQIEQVLLNLAVNAEDAMPNGGTLTFQLEDVYVKDASIAKHSGITPGSYVQLMVSDTGHGMDRETQERLFEPFFTTKKSGKGTGLGLSTVYGIVKQHNGQIQVYSEPGFGSTFKIYIPVVKETAEEAMSPAEIPPHEKGCGEKILIVEDNDMVREMTSQMLLDLGYQVITADNVDHCLAIFESQPEAIDLLLTDVIMPIMNGKELLTQLQSKRQDLKVLYMSGYTSDVIAHHGVLEDGVHFIQKPFSLAGLSRKIHEALNK